MVVLARREEGRTEPMGGTGMTVSTSQRVKNEASYLLMITHIAQQYHCSVGGQNVSSMSRKVTCLDFGSHFCCFRCYVDIYH